MGKSGFEFNTNQKADSRSIKPTKRKKKNKNIYIKKSNKKQKKKNHTKKAHIHMLVATLSTLKSEKRIKNYYSSIVSKTTTEIMN